MSHNPTTNRRKFDSLHQPPSISNTKPTVKRQLHPSTTTNSTSATASTVYNLTNHFSRLNANPNRSTNSQKYPHPQRLIDTRLQTKTLSKSAVLEPTTQKVGKPGKRLVLESEKNEQTKEKKEEKESKNEKVVVMKRKSFSDAQVELSNFLITNSAKVAAADMPAFIQIHAIGFARKVKDSLEKFSSKTLASSLKKEFDGVYGPAWHCIVGTSFGSFVTHSVGGFLYFSLDQKLYVLLFKTTVQRAD